ncbi:caspase [Penicillium brevicompactum]|uniref:caspase n=1 Tax=Penicillium brevicompactum TaxID=5074 RepID=UPI0025411B27|nr:caspase [Penicillium brevicompactum]KAJ5335663.1 caspase [Penicillium brevicompactum]
MDNQHAVTRHYAILIGIDAYPRGSLTSCVRDVTRIKECLEDKLSSVHVRTLTASKSSDPEIVTPREDPACWPTCRNVTSAFEAITSQAEPGDSVYIHYSGHGTRLDPCFDFSNQSTGDLALVLLKGDQSPEEYLKGLRLACFLKKMVDKNLKVTLVLDCCFSATVYRNGGPSVRYLPCDLVTAPSTLLDPEISFRGGNPCSAKRNGSMRDNWLVEPNRYAILAACGPDENAKGGSETSEKGLTYGVLSYFLLRTISAHGLGWRHRDIHHHIRAIFWESCIAQHPVLYGNADQGFFGPVQTHRGVRSARIVQREGIIQILAGQAHGVRDGDQFTVFFPTSTSGDGNEERLIAKIIQVGGLTSQLELLDPHRKVQTGWIAEPLTCAYLAQFPIHLAPDLPHRDEWLAALKERSLSTNINTPQIPVFHVVLKNIDEYEILDSSGQNLINLPALPRDQVDTGRICDVLEHLTRFKATKELNNQVPNAAFRTSFDVQIVNDGAVFGPEEQIEVRHNTPLELTINNKGDTTLYAHVYNLGPCWRVKGIIRATYEAIPPRKDPHNGSLSLPGKLSRRIRMTVPPIMKDYGSCEDIIKVFVTSQPTSFDLLELPKLGGLTDIFSGNRGSQYSSSASGDWMAVNFSIRTLA